MTEIKHLRDQAARAERLARDMLDAVTVGRLLQASQDYRREAATLEKHPIQASGPINATNWPDT